MRMFVRVFAVICLIGACLLTSCHSAPADSEQTTTTTPTTQTTAAIIEEKLEDMLTAAEISEAVGVEMGAPVVSGQGTILTSIGISTKAVLNVEVSEKPIEIFYDVMKAYPDLQACPNLGDTAWFSPVYNQLLVYGNGFMITIELTGTTDEDQNVQCLRCRQIASLLLEHL